MFVNDFYSNKRLPEAVTAIFIALLPKSDNLQRLEEYKPICLIGSLNQIILKFLSNRVKKVVVNLVSSKKSTFILGRVMTYDVLALNEIIDYAFRKKD